MVSKKGFQVGWSCKVNLLSCIASPDLGFFLSSFFFPEISSFLASILSFFYPWYFFPSFALFLLSFWRTLSWKIFLSSWNLSHLFSLKFFYLLFLTFPQNSLSQIRTLFFLQKQIFPINVFLFWVIKTIKSWSKNPKSCFKLHDSSYIRPDTSWSIGNKLGLPIQVGKA